MKRFVYSLLLALAFIISRPVLALEPVIEVSTPSGLKAWLIEDHTNPIVALKVTFRGGAALDPVGQEGLARLAASTMDEGAGSLDSQSFQAQLEDLSITLRFDAGMDSFSAHVLTLRENLIPAMALLQDALLNPRFDDEPVERIRRQLLSSLRQSQEDPNTIAALGLYKSIFQNHPYARGSKGTLDGIQAIKRDDLKNFARTRLGRDNLLIGIAGDINADEVRNLIERTFGQLPANAKPWDLPEAHLSFAQPLQVINKPIPQSSILFAQGGIDRHDKDFYAGYILNYILGGGGFASRLYEEVREKRGLVYSVYSYLANYDKASLWIAGAGTQNARVQETLDVVRAEWKKIATSGVTLEEVTNAKNYLIGSFALRFKSSQTIAAILTAMQRDQLPIDFLEQRNNEVQAVTLNDVNRIAKTRISPHDLQEIIVGQPNGL